MVKRKEGEISRNSPVGTIKEHDVLIKNRTIDVRSGRYDAGITHIATPRFVPAECVRNSLCSVY